MSRILLGTICGLVYGALYAASMIPLSFSDKSAALIGAFLNRFAIGFVIGSAHLPLPSWAQGLIFGVCPRRHYHQSLCANPYPWRCRWNHHRSHCGQVGRLVAITNTKVS